MRSPSPLRISPFGVLSAAALALLVFAGAAYGATRTVTISNFKFVDAVSGNSMTTISAGDTVTWNWSGGTHTTTSGACSPNCAPSGMWDSGTKSTGSFSFTFPTAGTFPYHCEIHGAMMQGSIVVQSAGTAPTANFTFSPSGVPVMGTPVNFTDTSTGTPTAWSWSFGDPASGTNNTSTQQNPSHTFQAAATYTVTLQASNASGSNSTSKTITVSSGGGLACVPDTETLCLNDGRFIVTADWTKADATNGHGNGIKLTSDSGYFWFFDPANIEIVVKVLNGCAITNGYWVFAAGLTNVKVNLRVVDTVTGAVYEKENPLNTAFVPIQDTGAFPSSCP